MGNGVNLDALLAAKALIKKVGSVSAAEEALRVLKKLVRPQYLWVVLAVCAARRLDFLRHGSGVQWLGR